MSLTTLLRSMVSRRAPLEVATDRGCHPTPRAVERLEPRVLFAAGDLDPTFGTGGMVRTSFHPEGDWAEQVAVGPDGSTFVVGWDAYRYRLSKYDPAGRLDTAFGAGGSVTSPLDSTEQPGGVAVTADGRIYVAGTVSTADPAHPYLVLRYRPDGSPDPDWGGGDGVATGWFTPGAASLVNTLALQPDGRVLIGGRLVGGDAHRAFVVARLAADGAPDASFGTAGVARVAYAPDGDPHAAEVIDVAVQPDGRIVAAGRLVAPAPSHREHLGVLRLTAAGARDATFGNDGWSTVDASPRTDVVRSVAVAPNGKVVLAGIEQDLTWRPFAAVLTPGGAPDAGFGGGDGVAPLPALADATDVFPLADGNFLFAGYGWTFPTDPPAHGHFDLLLVALRGDGLPDNSFGADGVARGDGGHHEGGSGGAAMHPDGRRVVVAGYWQEYFGGGPGGPTDTLVARFLAPRPSASAAGTVYYDTNGNGLRDAGETPVAGFGLYVDADRDGVRDDGEARTRTDDNGAYAFDGLAAGTHHVRTEPPAGWVNTAPAAGLRAVTLADRQDVGGLTFAVRQAPLTLRAAADAYVRNGAYANANYGAAAQLLAKRSATAGSTRETYLRFDLSSVQAVGSATLRLFGRLSSTSNASVTTTVYDAANTTWGESALTWNTKPVAGTAARGSLTVRGTTARWYEVDLTTFLRNEKAAGRNAVTLVLRNLTSTDAQVVLASDEAAANGPELVVVPAAPVAQGLVVSAATTLIPEGGSRPAFRVRLAARPAADVVVDVTKDPGGDPDLTTATHALTFTPANWYVDQSVTVAAAEDADGSNGAATFTVRLPGLSSRSVRVTEGDNDVPATTGLLRATADAHVRDGTYAATNYGTATQLQVKQGSAGYTRESHLRFDLSSVSTIASARLRLFGRLDNTSAASAGFTVYEATNAPWSEATVTWNTRPASAGVVRGSGTVTGTTGRWYEVDLTAFLQAEKAAGRNVVSLVIRASAASPSTILFDSDEGANRPELVLKA